MVLKAITLCIEFLKVNSQTSSICLVFGLSMLITKFSYLIELIHVVSNNILKSNRTSVWHLIG